MAATEVMQSLQLGQMKWHKRLCKLKCSRELKSGHAFDSGNIEKCSPRHEIWKVGSPQLGRMSLAYLEMWPNFHVTCIAFCKPSLKLGLSLI